MMQDEVLFTLQWATMADLVHREIGRALKEAFGLTYLMFCLMASVRSHGNSMTLSEFPSGVLANDNTVVVAANECARLGLLAKRRCEDDRRVVRLQETPAGGLVLERGFKEIYRHLRATVWSNHTRADIDQTMHAFPSVVEKLHISPVEMNHRCHPVVTPSYLMCVAGFLRKWELCTQRYAGLSFTEYRCLALLKHRIQALSCAAIADELMLDRSSVSPIVSHLAREGYATIKTGRDRRSRTVAPTARGGVAAALVTAELEKITAWLFSDADAAIKAKANELHMRMYASYIGSLAARAT